MYDSSLYDGDTYDGVGSFGLACPFYVPDHHQKMIDRLTEIFRISYLEDGTVEGPKNLEKLLRIASTMIQFAEDAACQTVIYRMLRYARGVQLDTCGKIIGLRRWEVGDQQTNEEIYRMALQAWNIVNNSQGLYENIYAIIGFLMSTSSYTSIQQYNPNSFIVTSDGVPLIDSLIVRAINDAKPEISQVSVIQAVQETEGPFRFPSFGYSAITASGGAALAISFPKASFVPALNAGDLKNGQLVITDGTSAEDVRNIDAVGAVDAGLNWDFTVTAAFSFAPDATSVANLYPYSTGLGFAGATGSYYALPLLAGSTSRVIRIAQASFVPAIIAGDLASSQIIITDGDDAEQIVYSDTTGAVADGADWLFALDEPLDGEPSITSIVNIISTGGKLGRVIM